MRSITVLIVSSTKDPASININNGLLDQSDWKEIDTFSDNPVYRNTSMKNLVSITLNDRKITHENLEFEVENSLRIKPKQAIFLSRHRSKTGEPTLTVHPIGNYGKAEFGGKTKELVTASPKMMAHLIRLVKSNAEKAKLYHKVCLEVTHHGPFMNIPTLFVEVGSTEQEWVKKEPANIIAKSVLELLAKYHYEEDFKDKTPILIGIGGGHYAPRFTDVIFEKNASFGHMIPRYQIDQGNIDGEMFEKAIQATPNVSYVYFHRKSLKKSQIREYKEWFENRGIPSISSNDLESL